MCHWPSIQMVSDKEFVYRLLENIYFLQAKFFLKVSTLIAWLYASLLQGKEIMS